MKLSKLLISFIGLAIIGSSFFPQPAKADLFCYPWEDDCEANGRIGTDTFGTDHDYNPVFDVYLQNNSDRTIWVAIHYKYTSEHPCANDACGDGAETQMMRTYDPWSTGGYWQLEPGQKVLTTASTDNRYIYFHAHDEYGNTWGNSEIYKAVKGEEQPFFKADMGGEIGSYTQGFN